MILSELTGRIFFSVSRHKNCKSYASLGQQRMDQKAGFDEFTERSRP